MLATLLTSDEWPPDGKKLRESCSACTETGDLTSALISAMNGAASLFTVSTSVILEKSVSITPPSSPMILIAASASCRGTRRAIAENGLFCFYGQELVLDVVIFGKCTELRLGTVIKTTLREFNH